MKTRILGRTGLQVSEIGLGTWAIGGLGNRPTAFNYGPVEEQAAFDVLDAYLETGGNFLDTAENYHDAEARIGKYLRQHPQRDRLIIASKVWQTTDAEVRPKLEKQLRLLGRDALDIYMMHNPPDTADEMNRALDVFAKFKQEGKIRFIGASIKGHNVTDETVRLLRQYIHSGRVDVILCIYSCLRQKNRTVFAEAKQAGVGMIGRTVLESGFLTGQYKPGHKFTAQEDHRKRWPQEKLDHILRMVQDLEKLTVKPPYTSVAQVAVRFALDEPDLSCILLGAETAAHVRENMAMANLPALSAGFRQEITRQFAGKETEVSLMT